MARWVRMPVRVIWNGEGTPVRIALAGMRRPVPVERCLERWRECGEWWNGETEREVYRLLLEGGSVAEVSGPLRVGTGRDGGREAGSWRLDTWFD